MQNILITTEGIQKNLKNIKPLDALCEYIWNGFDASASIINVNFSMNEFGIIDAITISDNGVGIPYEELAFKFQPFSESNKAIMNDNNHSLPHGRKGIGRLTFFSFAQIAQWDTVYQKGGVNYQYFIKMNRDSLNKYDDNAGNKPSVTKEGTGTKVHFKQIITMDKEEIIKKVKEEFFWFLELHKDSNFEIWIDNEKIDYSDCIVRREMIDTSEYGLTYQYQVEMVQWSISLGKEYSKFYFKNSSNQEVYKEATKLNKKSDDFFHSVYIKSEYFNQFICDDKACNTQMFLFPNKSDIEFKKLCNILNKYLLKFRKNYLKDASNKYIDLLIEKKVYPYFDTTNMIDCYRKQELDNLVATLYTAQPKIFTSLSDDNKKVTLHLLNLIMDNSNKPELFNVLKQVVELEEDELEELSEVLKYTTLNNITKVIKLLEDRVKVIQGLKELVFDESLFAKEVPHIQQIVENHYWLFGEQYQLITAAEPDFELALMGLLKTTKGKSEKVTIDSPDKNKEMDIYMIRQDRRGDVTENVVVELKRPTVSLGEDQLSQVKKYMRVIKSDDRFNATDVKWTYYLVGNKLNSNGYIEDELESHRTYGENHLVHCDKTGNHKIYVMTWSDIFDDFSKRHDYLMSKLQLEEEIWMKKHETADDVVNDVCKNSASMDGPIVPKRAVI